MSKSVKSNPVAHGKRSLPEVALSSGPGLTRFQKRGSVSNSSPPASTSSDAWEADEHESETVETTTESEHAADSVPHLLHHSSIKKDALDAFYLVSDDILEALYEGIGSENTGLMFPMDLDWTGWTWQDWVLSHMETTSGVKRKNWDTLEAAVKAAFRGKRRKPLKGQYRTPTKAADITPQDSQRESILMTDGMLEERQRVRAANIDRVRAQMMQAQVDAGYHEAKMHQCLRTAKEMRAVLSELLLTQPARQVAQLALAQAMDVTLRGDAQLLKLLRWRSRTSAKSSAMWLGAMPDADLSGRDSILRALNVLKYAYEQLLPESRSNDIAEGKEPTVMCTSEEVDEKIVEAHEVWSKEQSDAIDEMKANFSEKFEELLDWMKSGFDI